MTRIEPKNMNISSLVREHFMFLNPSTNHLESQTKPSTISGTVEDFHDKQSYKTPRRVCYQRVISMLMFIATHLLCHFRLYLAHADFLPIWVRAVSEAGALVPGLFALRHHVNFRRSSACSSIYLMAAGLHSVSNRA